MSIGSSHNPTNQKGCWISKKNSEILINIYVLSFKAMAIMANYCFLNILKDVLGTMSHSFIKKDATRLVIYVQIAPYLKHK
jgi:hypothetical protein